MLERDFDVELRRYAAIQHRLGPFDCRPLVDVFMCASSSLDEARVQFVRFFDAHLEIETRRKCQLVMMLERFLGRNIKQLFPLSPASAVGFFKQRLRRGALFIQVKQDFEHVDDLLQMGGYEGFPLIVACQIMEQLQVFLDNRCTEAEAASLAAAIGKWR